MEMATTFANHASLALELAEARRDQERVLLLEDRARIARDLHDHVIQQIFAAGLMVQATTAHLDSERDVATLSDVVYSLDEAIKQIRVSIFQLQPAAGTGIRSAVIDVVGEVRPALGFDPRLDLDGPLDSLSTDELIRDVTAVVREALTNVAKHAHATAAQLSVHATSAQLTVTISDNGRGMGGRDAQERAGQHALPRRGPAGLDGGRRAPRPRRNHPGLDRADRLTPVGRHGRRRTDDRHRPRVRDDEARERADPRHRQAPGVGDLARLAVGLPAGRLQPQLARRRRAARPGPVRHLCRPAVLLRRAPADRVRRTADPDRGAAGPVRVARAAARRAGADVDRAARSSRTRRRSRWRCSRGPCSVRGTPRSSSV